MDYRLLFPSLYIGAADLRGQEKTLTIRRVVVEELKTDRGSEKKPVVYFDEVRDKADSSKDKRLVLNKTNAKTIAKVYDENEIDNWVGKRITLFPSTVSVGGEMRDCIRVRPTIPQPPKEKE